MVPLILFSLVAMGLILERLQYFLRLKVDLHGWFEGLSRIPGGDSKALPEYLQKLKKHPLKNILTSLWTDRNLGRSDLEALAQEEAEEKLQDLERNLKPLSVIAILSPLLGLLGTVLGIMRAFMETQDAGRVDPTLLASGIWQALITTFFGLAIAIPVWLLYYYFTSRVDRQVFLMEFFSSRFLRWMQQKGFVTDAGNP